MRASGALHLAGILKEKLKDGRPTLEEMRPDHVIRSSVAITILPQGRNILMKRSKEMRFFENILSLDF